MKYRGSTPILRYIVGVHPRNIHTKFKANPCSKVHVDDNNDDDDNDDDDDDDDDDDGHSLIARVTLTH